MPGFAVLGLCIVIAARAEHLKPVRHIEVPVPAIYGTDNSGPYGITYLSPGKLAVWFTDNTSGQLSKRERLQSTDPWRMKLNILDTTSGSISTREYPTRKVSTGLQVQADGSIILLNGPLVRCLAPDFRQTGSVNLPEMVIHRNERLLDHSPGGHTVWAFEAGNLVTAVRIDAHACKLAGGIAIEPSITTISASDNYVIATDRAHVAISDLTGKWQSLYRADPCCIDDAVFASQRVILVFRQIPHPGGNNDRNPQENQPKRSLLFLDPQGKLLLEEPLDRGYEPGPIVPSGDGRFVLVATPKPDFSSELLKYRLRTAKYRVTLYDLSTLKPIFVFDVSRNNASLFALALSPDARQVAVLADSKVAIYDIPPRP